MFFVGQSVEVPDEWREVKGANFAVDALGNPFDWRQVHGERIAIRTSPFEPSASTVYAKVPYAGNWFYVNRHDINSKETLTMLSVVLTLKAGGIPTERPVLTLPVGG